MINALNNNNAIRFGDSIRIASSRVNFETVDKLADILTASLRLQGQNVEKVREGDDVFIHTGGEIALARKYEKQIEAAKNDDEFNESLARYEKFLGGATLLDTIDILRISQVAERFVEAVKGIIEDRKIPDPGTQEGQEMATIKEQLNELGQEIILRPSSSPPGSSNPSKDDQNPSS